MNMKYDYQSIACRLAEAMFEPASNEMNTGIKHPGGRSDDPAMSHLDAAYRCIHLEPRTFIEMLGMVEVKESFYQTGPNGGRCRFLDVGCGVGQKVFLAQIMGLEGYGLEIREKHANKAKQLLNQYMPNDGLKDRIITGDAITFERYAEFDFIYFYCPSHNAAVEKKIEMAIANGAKVGAVVLPRGRVFEDSTGEYALAVLGWKRFGGLYNSYYKRISDKPVGLTEDIVTRELQNRGWMMLRDYAVKNKKDPRIGKVQKTEGGYNAKIDIRKSFFTLEEAVAQEGMIPWTGMKLPKELKAAA